VRRFLALAVAAASLSAGASLAATPPPGATALCRDGTYSYSTHRSGTCSHHGGVARWLGGAGGSARVALGRTILLGARTAASGCRRGALPDRRCSPGAYYSGLTRAVICAAGFRTGSIRDVPQSEKYAVEREYRMPARLYGRTIEIDHIVPLELGGSNDIANLFPEPGAGAAGYHAKDRLENRLRALVCSGRVTLASARAGIARNWEAMYRQLD
jgi:hypothetical protein